MKVRLDITHIDEPNILHFIVNEETIDAVTVLLGSLIPSVAIRTLVINNINSLKNSPEKKPSIKFNIAGKVWIVEMKRKRR